LALVVLVRHLWQPMVSMVLTLYFQLLHQLAVAVVVRILLQQATLVVQAAVHLLLVRLHQAAQETLHRRALAKETLAAATDQLPHHSQQAAVAVLAVLVVLAQEVNLALVVLAQPHQLLEHQ
jgi:hypothetical protein